MKGKRLIKEGVWEVLKRGYSKGKKGTLVRSEKVRKSERHPNQKLYRTCPY